MSEIGFNNYLNSKLKVQCKCSCKCNVKKSENHSKIKGWKMQVS